MNSLVIVVSLRLETYTFIKIVSYKLVRLVRSSGDPVASYTSSTVIEGVLVSKNDT